MGKSLVFFSSKIKIKLDKIPKNLIKSGGDFLK